jgi:hypothetical protein
VPHAVAVLVGDAGSAAAAVDFSVVGRIAVAATKAALRG